MKALKIKEKDITFFQTNYFKEFDCSEMIIPLKRDEIMQFSLKETVAVVVSLEKDDLFFELKGTVVWKRLKSINLIGKKLPSGLGVKLDEISVEYLKQYFPKELDFEDENEDMVGGNYIKIRRSYIKKDNIEKKSTKNVEQRKQPRQKIAVPLKIFLNNELYKHKSVNISTEGMAIESNILPKIGTEILIVFENKTSTQSFVLKSKVVRHITQEDFKGFAIKFIFENKNQQKELMKFIAKNS